VLRYVKRLAPDSRIVHQVPSPVAMRASDAVRQTFAIILAGGRGSRLHELTQWRAKPAVPFGGKFRIIDFPLSNCVNAAMRRIAIATQYKSQSLIRHIQRGWSFLDGRIQEFIELLPAQQRIGESWYRGTADAVYQNLDLVRHNNPKFVLVLAGDHVYKMDYRVMLHDHLASGCDATVACVKVPLAEASAFGVMAVDGNSRIVAFEEKPASPRAMTQDPGSVLASMGIYLFNAEFLYERLRLDAHDPASRHDFGTDLIPRLLRSGARLNAHDFGRSCVNMAGEQPYWRDVGTVDAYWKANIDLTQVVPQLNLYDRDWPIWTHQEQLPPAKFVFDDDQRRGMAVDSLVAGGCLLSGCTVRRSLLSSDVRVHSYSVIEDSVVLPDVDIGRHAAVRRAVIDKYCRIPPHLRIGYDSEADRRRYHVTDQGITLVTPEMLGQRAAEEHEGAIPP
jgi:glucose-1-phosphate adenylyltransferase